MVLEDQVKSRYTREGKKKEERCGKETNKLSHTVPRNDVIEYLRGINVVSCGRNGRKWTKFVSRKLRRALCSVWGRCMQCVVWDICNVQYSEVCSVGYMHAVCNTAKLQREQYCNTVSLVVCFAYEQASCTVEKRDQTGLDHNWFLSE